MFSPFTFWKESAVESSPPLFPTDASGWTSTISTLGLGLGDPTHHWNFNLASGDPVDTISAVSLSALGTPGYEVVPNQWPDQLGMSFPVNGNNRLQAGSSLWDAEGSFWVFVVMEFGATLPGSLTTLLRGRDGTSGWDLNHNSDGTLTFSMDDQTTTQQLTTTGGSHAGEAHLIALGRNVTTGEAYLCTGRSQAAVVLTATGDLSSSEVSGVGRFTTANISPIVSLTTWFGADAEGDGIDDWTAYATNLGIL